MTEIWRGECIDELSEKKSDEEISISDEQGKRKGKKLTRIDF
jgi:hypothetical protein